jgi:hypothetical protein
MTCREAGPSWNWIAVIWLDADDRL